jgi:hypothetical protein
MAMLFIDSVLTGEFASLDELIDASKIVLIVVSPVDRPDFTRSNGRFGLDDPMQKLRLPIIRLISWSSKGSEKAIETMNPMSKVPMVDVN